MKWIDLEAVISRRLRDALGVDAGADAPSSLEGVAFVRVTAAAGDDDGLNDRCLVDVEAFSPSRRGAYALAEDARAAMRALAGTDASDDGRELIDSVGTAVRPHWVDYRNPDVQRVVASYRITTRLQ